MPHQRSTVPLSQRSGSPPGTSSATTMAPNAQDKSKFDVNTRPRSRQGSRHRSKEKKKNDGRQVRQRIKRNASYDDQATDWIETANDEAEAYLNAWLSKVEASNSANSCRQRRQHRPQQKAQLAGNQRQHTNGIWLALQPHRKWKEHQQGLRTNKKN